MKVGHQRRRHGDPFPLDSGALRDLAAESGCFEPQRAQWICIPVIHSIFHILPQNGRPLQFRIL